MLANPSYTTWTSTPRSAASISACLNSSPRLSFLTMYDSNSTLRFAPRIAASMSAYRSSPNV